MSYFIYSFFCSTFWISGMFREVVRQTALVRGMYSEDSRRFQIHLDDAVIRGSACLNPFSACGRLLSPSFIPEPSTNNQTGFQMFLFFLFSDDDTTLCKRSQRWDSTAPPPLPLPLPLPFTLAVSNSLFHNPIPIPSNLTIRFDYLFRKE
eukprot:c9045_g5_i2.p1 GENE.c9045_g5_i2~~c9045_g5_i2.p1  ORF type:complete len:150 (+),score=36.42 c9045_g5_i2:498-947(+)